MPAKILITRPNHDTITHYLCEWTQDTIALCSQKGFIVHDLKGPKATRAQLESHLVQYTYDFILLNGHGSPTQVAGHKDEILIETGSNHDHLKNAIIYSLSCSSASQLGKDCVDGGTGAYAGYMERFILVHDKNSESRPLQDKYAKPVMQSATQFSNAILKGHTVAEALERTKREYNDEITRLQSSEAEPGAGNIVLALIWNMMFLNAYGNTTASI